MAQRLKVMPSAPLIVDKKNQVKRALQPTHNSSFTSPCPVDRVKPRKSSMPPQISQTTRLSLCNPLVLLVAGYAPHSKATGLNGFESNRSALPLQRGNLAFLRILRKLTQSNHLSLSSNLVPPRLPTFMTMNTMSRCIDHPQVLVFPFTPLSNHVRAPLLL